MKNNTFTKIIFLFFINFLILSSVVSAQEIWTGMGDGTSWNDAANWESNTVPAAGALVEIKKDVTITGTATDAPAQIKLANKATVTLNLDMTIGDGTLNDHAVKVGNRCTLNFGGNAMINPKDTKAGINVSGGADSITVNIMSGATVTILQGLNGVNMANPLSFFNVEGTLTINDGVKNGIKSSCTMTNNGTIDIGAMLTDGIIIGAGTFENKVMGVVEITKPVDDCLEVLGGSTFTNYGILALVASDSASSSNNCIALGKDTLATFINEVSGMIAADGGLDTIGRAISVDTAGVFSNKGEVTIIGGDEKGRFYNRGTISNELGGIIDAEDGRMNINFGTFTNNGLVKSTFGGSGIFTNGTTINNAFFDYENSNNFSSGSGTITDNGINVNNAKIDAGGNCTIDIGETTYEYFTDNASLGMTDASGALTFADNSLAGDSIILTTTFDGIELTVINICAQAVMSTSTFAPIQSESLLLFPSLIQQQNILTIDLLEMENGKNIEMEVVNLNGQRLQNFRAMGGNYFSLNVNDLPNGMYFIRSQNLKTLFIGKFIITR